MKTTVVFILIAALGIVAVSSAQIPFITRRAPANTTTLGEAVQVMIKSFQKIMPCGAPELGLPPLAPFKQDKIELNINEEMLSLTGKITNLIVTGINKFIIIDLSTKGNRTTFDAIYEDIDILGEFDTKLYENLAGFKYNVKPKGLLNIHFKDIRINGGMTIGENDFNGMSFTDIDYYIDIGDVTSEVLESQWSTAVNRFFNKYVEDTTLLLVEENREAISKAISGYLIPVLNSEAITTSQSEFIQQLAEYTSIYDSIKCDL